MKITRNFSSGIIHDSGSLPFRMSGYLMDFGPYLPMTLTAGSPHAAVRLLGLALLVVWGLPVFAVVMIPLLALFVADIVATTVKEKP